MDRIDERLALMRQAVESNDSGSGLGKLDWDSLTQEEQVKFRQNFERDPEGTGGEDTFTTTYKDREFTIQIYNYKIT